jgi:putative chitinase
MTPQQLAQCTGCSLPDAIRWLPAITPALQRWEISTPARQAAFLAQIGVESAHLTTLQESFNYSADALQAMWPDRFDADLAQQVGRTLDHPADQQRIANIAYAGRFGNGDVASGDGWRFSGKGLPQLTFHDNYEAAGYALGLDLVHHPELLLIPVNAASCAGWYWWSRDCNQLADSGDFVRITVRINGGTTDLAARQALWAQGKEALHAG